MSLMYTFIGILVLVAVIVVARKTICASRTPVNGEEKELKKLDDRIRAVNLILHSHIPHV